MKKSKKVVEKIECLYDDPCRCIRPALTPDDVAKRRTAREASDAWAQGNMREYLQTKRLGKLPPVG
jgi:hypothetical protein